jgi:II/X family phage/plasmid replication protein
MGKVMSINSDGVVVWEKNVLDIDALRSDSVGIFWSVGRDVDNEYLIIGASPASLEFNNNVFGSSDIRHCARVLVRSAGLALEMILPVAEKWSCRRVDVTENYLFSSPRLVKQWLKVLNQTDSGRHHATSACGDTVEWNKGSPLRYGKAYHKGPQLNFLLKKGKKLIIDSWQLSLADRLGRLELRLGSQWWRRFYAVTPNQPEVRKWWDLSEKFFREQFENYFGNMFGKNIEVADMGKLLEELIKVAPSVGRAKAAHDTWALIKVVGLTQVKETKPSATLRKHLSWLRAAGLSDADFCVGNVVAFTRHEVNICQPVTSWEELRRVA